MIFYLKDDIYIEETIREFVANGYTVAISKESEEAEKIRVSITLNTADGGLQ